MGLPCKPIFVPKTGGTHMGNPAIPIFLIIQSADRFGKILPSLLQLAAGFAIIRR